MPIPQKNIKQRIMERILTILEPLKGTQGLRKIERVRTLFLLEPQKPCLHVVAGPEIVLEEDNRGYHCEFGLLLKLMVSEARNLEDEVDRYVGKIQELMENDAQLNGGDATDVLAIRTKYDGEQPFGEEILKPEGGTVIAYVIEYRRYSAEPNYNY
jgi:hypothetical protein